MAPKPGEHWAVRASRYAFRVLAGPIVAALLGVYLHLLLRAFLWGWRLG